MRLLLASLVLILSGCEGPAARHAPSTPDKARLYGDPGLVPTREGERARRELAVAGELQRSLESVAAVEAALVTVQLEPVPARALMTITAATETPTDERELEHYANEAARALLGADAQATVILDPGSAKAPSRGAGLPIPLALALLGLGVSAGIALERYRTARRPR